LSSDINAPDRTIDPHRRPLLSLASILVIAFIGAPCFT
jgi:hypothetical protein